MKYLKLFLPQSIMNQIKAYGVAADGEISAWGKTIERSDGNYEVTDLILFKQVCNPAHTSLDDEDLTNMYLAVVRKGEDPVEWNFWWHSHVDMTAFFSSEDTGTMRRISGHEEGGVPSTLISLVTNREGDYMSCMYHDGVEVARFNLAPLAEVSDEFMIEVRQQVAELVTIEAREEFNPVPVDEVIFDGNAYDKFIDGPPQLHGRFARRREFPVWP